MTTTILLHIYYDDTFYVVYNNLRHMLHDKNVNVLVNISISNPHIDRLHRLISHKLPKAIIIKSSNQGKDIGGKLSLLHIYLKMGLKSDLLLFLHDKKSPQLVNGESWYKNLFEIASKKNISKIISMFNRDQKIGMIGSKTQVLNIKNKPHEEIFVGNEGFILKLAKEYNLISKDYGFVGGTMFWVKESIFTNFFNKVDPLIIRKTLEPGNVMDDFGPTITHSWERLFGWIVSSSGHKITGV